MYSNKPQSQILIRLLDKDEKVIIQKAIGFLNLCHCLGFFNSNIFNAQSIHGFRYSNLIHFNLDTRSMPLHSSAYLKDIAK